MFLAGSSVVVGKLILETFPVFLASGLRFAVSSLILLPIILRKEGKIIFTIDKRDWVILLMQAFTGVFLFSFLLLYGLRITGGIESGIILSTAPAVIGIISFVFLKERVDIIKGIGLAFSVIGLIAINLLGDVEQEGFGLWKLVGNLFVFIAVIGEALFTILSKFLSNKVSSVMIAASASFFGFIMFMPLSIYEAVHFDFSKTTFIDWLFIIYYGAFVTVISFILWFHGVQLVNGSTAAVFSSILPISSLLLSVIILKEPFMLGHIVGITSILSGIVFIVMYSKKDERKIVASEKRISTK